MECISAAWTCAYTRCVITGSCPSQAATTSAAGRLGLADRDDTARAPAPWSLDGKPRCEPIATPAFFLSGAEQPSSTCDHSEVRRALKVPLKEVPSSTLLAATNRDDT